MLRESAIADIEGQKSTVGNKKLRKHFEDPKPKQWRWSEMNQTESMTMDSEVYKQTTPTIRKTNATLGHVTSRSLRCSATIAAPTSRLSYSNDGVDQNRSSKISWATTSKCIHVCKGGEGQRKTILTSQFLCRLRGKKVPTYYKTYDLFA